MNLTPLADPAQIAAIIALVTQIVSYYLSPNANRTAILRSLSVLLGAILVPLAALSAPGVHVTLNALVTNVESGILLGAGVTVAVKGAKIAAAKVPAISVRSNPAPSAETPVVPTTQ